MAIGALGAAGITGTVLLLDDDPESCAALVERVDKLSPELKAVYARPGKNPRGIPELADAEERKRCDGDPEALLEATEKR